MIGSEKLPSKNLKWFSRGEAGTKTSMDNYHLESAKDEYKSLEFLPTFIAGMITWFAIFYGIAVFF